MGYQRRAGGSGIEVLKRRRRVEDYLLRGLTDQNSMSVALGVSQGTISLDVKEIHGRWLREEIKVSRLKRSRRVKQLEFAAQQAIDAWERSKQNAEEISTVYTPRKCADCKGTGIQDEITGNWCLTCNGDGKVMTEVVTKKIRGQVGDAVQLRLFKECVVEAAKIEGSYVRKAAAKSNGEGGSLGINIQLDLSKAPPDLLLQAKAAYLRLTESMESRDAAIIETSSQPAEETENE